MKFAPTYLAIVVVAGPAQPAPPPAGNPYAAEVRAALADAKRLDPVTASRTRYLSLAQAGWPVPDNDHAGWRLVLTLWTNGLSREADFYRPRRVSATVLAVNVDDYGWDPQTWEKLADEDPYYHVQVDLAVNTVGRMYHPAGGGYKAGWYDTRITKNIRTPALAPWLPRAEAAELVALTQSAAPIVRGDWWFSRAAIQFGRKGTGYFDWLQVKDRDEFDKLVGLNVKESQRVKREVAAIVARSGVANFPRQIFRFQSVTGGYWQTRDRITDNKDAGNALRQLDNDYKHEAEEIYGTLANGLFAYFLCDVNGKRQDSAPDGVGFSKAATGNDGKIHPVECAKCHTEGLRPINDWGRRVYRGPLALNSPDPVQYRRLAQLYVSELQEWIDDDNAMYARKLKRLTGLKPDEAAKTIGLAWGWYQDANLMPADLAAEFGMGEAEYLAKLRAYYRANQLGDPVLASHIADPPIPIRRDDVEQVYPIVAPIVLEGRP